MIQESEIVVLLMGLCVLAIVQTPGSRAMFASLRGRKTLISAYHVLVVGWLLTVLEGLFWPDLLNILEHACYATSSVLLAMWCWRAFGRKELP